MVREIIQIGDERLNQISTPIDKEDIKSETIQNLAKDLIDTCNAHESEAAGLSAVQIGILKRMFAVKDLRKGRKTKDFIVMINPEVIQKSKEMNMEWEGCMSISANGLRLYGPVYRPNIITVRYTDLSGKTQKVKASGFFSSLLQHEQDHLDGVLFLKYITNPANIWNEIDLNEYMQKNRKTPGIKK